MWRHFENTSTKQWFSWWRFVAKKSNFVLFTAGTQTCDWFGMTGVGEFYAWKQIRRGTRRISQDSLAPQFCAWIRDPSLGVSKVYFRSSLFYLSLSTKSSLFTVRRNPSWENFDGRSNCSSFTQKRVKGSFFYDQPKPTGHCQVHLLSSQWNQRSNDNLIISNCTVQRLITSWLRNRW